LLLYTIAKRCQKGFVYVIAWGRVELRIDFQRFHNIRHNIDFNKQAACVADTKRRRKGGIARAERERKEGGLLASLVSRTRVSCFPIRHFHPFSAYHAGQWISSKKIWLIFKLVRLVFFRASAKIKEKNSPKASMFFGVRFSVLL